MEATTVNQSHLKGVVLIGGPSRGTRFRPLSLDSPKPLFPIAGQPMVQHQIQALSKLKDMKEILLIGFYEPQKLAPFLEKINRECRVPVKYLFEYQPLGTAGGLYHFRDQILRGKPEFFIVMHVDICCSFPLEELMQFHISRPEGALCSLLGTALPPDSTPSNYGSIVAHPQSHAVLHYVEKPESLVSEIINCGVYVFHPGIFKHMEELISERSEREVIFPGTVRDNPEMLMLERDVLASLPDALPVSKSGLFSSRPPHMDIVRHQKIFVFECHQKGFFWQQIKVPNEAITANALYLQHFNKISPELLTLGKDGLSIVGQVIIHKDANVHPTAVIGPNVSIGAHCTIHAGVRIRDAIVLERTVLKARCCLLNCVVGSDNIVGEWARVEGAKNALANSTLTTNGLKLPGATVIGDGVSIADEIIIRNCIVLSHKELKSNYFNEILM